MVAGTTGGPQQPWLVLTEQVRAAPSFAESPALGELYQLALRDGARALARFRALNEQERQDIVAEKFVTTYVEMLQPTISNPRAFFLTAVNRAALSALRRKQTEQKYEPALIGVSEGTARTEDDTVTTLSLARRLAQLSPRDQQLLRAVYMGEDRDRVARQFETSRANVDQIVSRVARMGRQP